MLMGREVNISYTIESIRLVKADYQSCIVEAGKTSAARKEADKKGTDKVTFTVDGKPA